MNKFSKMIYVIVGFVFTLCAIKVYYDSSLNYNKMGWYVYEGSPVDISLKGAETKDLNYIKAEEIKVKDTKVFKYSTLADGTISIDEYNGSNGVLVIPSKIDDKTVSIVNISGKFRKIVISKDVKAITGKLEVSNILYENQLTIIIVFAVTFLIYLTVIMSSTKKFDFKIAVTSIVYLLIPIVYILCTKKYMLLSTKYDYTYLALMTVTSICYLIITAIMVGYTKGEVEEKKSPARKTQPTKKKTTTKKKTSTRSKTSTKKK